MAAQLLENRQRQRNARHEDKGGIAAERIGRERDDLLDWHKHVATSSCFRHGTPLQRQALPSPYVRAICVLPVEAPRIGFRAALTSSRTALASASTAAMTQDDRP